jgi:hypothetical protein
MTCQSECDCGAPGGYPHEPDCHSFRICDEGRWCDKHLNETTAEMRAEWWRRPTEERYRQDMIDAGRSHLLPDVMADRIDRARMREKDELFDVAVISDERRNS